MKIFTTAFILLSTFLPLPFKTGLDDCVTHNNAFQAGESITYKVYYKVAGVYVGAGEAVFSSSLDQINGKPVYHVVGDGKTYSFYDNFFKVRDKYESYIDTGSLQPYKFVRNVNEGGHKTYENVTFNKSTNTALTNQGVFKVPECVQDVMSSMYYARNVDFSHLKPGDKIPFSMFLDNQVYNLYIRYLGKETIKTKYGKFRAIKFKPLLIKGTIFEGGEKMTVWVSDDANHIPVRVESPIAVGSVVVDMINFQNRRHPLSSLIDL
ncbi:MAG TPA: DUF3108 domain-containing protein [Puia sp.]|nr:DUF3108 domain-containing protein [Puia sp.]